MTALESAFHATIKYLRGSYHEMRTVVWPTRRQIVVHTILVIVFSTIIASFLGSLDIFFAFILEKVLLK